MCCRYVRLAAQELRVLDRNEEVKVCTVIGFPLGASTTGTHFFIIQCIESKVFETEDAIKNGADEIDMVMAIGKMKEGDYEYVKNEISRVHDVCEKNYKTLKVIIEIYPITIYIVSLNAICYLTDEEIVKASELAFEGGADFVKTSTGFGPSHSILVF